MSSSLPLRAGGNSSFERSARAKAQLRDRHGRWIEMGGGARFELKGGAWQHGTISGWNASSGTVEIKLDNGTTAIVPANKVEQPEAVLHKTAPTPAPALAPVPAPAPAPTRAEALLTRIAELKARLPGEDLALDAAARNVDQGNVPAIASLLEMVAERASDPSVKAEVLELSQAARTMKDDGPNILDSPKAPAPAPARLPPTPAADPPEKKLSEIDMDAPKFTGSQKTSISEYRMPDNAIWMNDALRNRDGDFTDPEDDELKEYFDEIHADLLGLAENSHLNEPVRLYRGMSTDDEFTVGELVESPAWSSTTTSRKTGENFTKLAGGEGREKGGIPTLLEIDAPVGTSVINTLHNDVEEMILPPGTTYRTDSVSTDENGLRHVKGTIISQTNNDRLPDPPPDTVPAPVERAVSDPTEPTIDPPEKKLTPDEEDALNRYAEAGFGYVNQALRSDQEPGGDSEDWVPTLDAMINRDKLTEDETVYRGVTPVNRETYQKFLDKLKPGQVLSDKGYVSTSRDESMAKQFLDVEDQSVDDGGYGEVVPVISDMPRVMFEIDAPAGSNGLDVDSYLPDMAQNEILFPRDSRFEIESVTPDGDNLRVKARLLKSSEPTPSNSDDQTAAPFVPSRPWSPDRPVVTGPGADEVPTDWAGLRDWVKSKDTITLDTETTGLSVEDGEDQVVELAATRVRSDGSVDRFTTLVNPGKPIDPKASAVHGITDDMVKNAPSPAEAFATFQDWSNETSNNLLVAHNANFDDSAVQGMSPDAPAYLADSTFLDTFRLARAAIPKQDAGGPTTSHALGALADVFDVNLGNAHRAGDDAQATSDLLPKMLDYAAQGDLPPNALNDLPAQNQTFKDAWPGYLDELKAYKSAPAIENKVDPSLPHAVLKKDAPYVWEIGDDELPDAVDYKKKSLADRAAEYGLKVTSKDGLNTVTGNGLAMYQFLRSENVRYSDYFPNQKMSVDEIAAQVKNPDGTPADLGLSNAGDEQTRVTAPDGSTIVVDTLQVPMLQATWALGLKTLYSDIGKAHDTNALDDWRAGYMAFETEADLNTFAKTAGLDVVRKIPGGVLEKDDIKNTTNAIVLVPPNNPRMVAIYWHPDANDMITKNLEKAATPSQNRPVVRKDDARKSGGQTRTNFVNETTGAPMGKTETGDTFEQVFMAKGTKLIQDRYGEFHFVTGAGAGGSRTTPLDLLTVTHGVELKSISIKAKNQKTAIKADEVARKLQAVFDANVEPLLLVQVVDQDNHTISLHGMENFGSKAVSRMESFGTFEYTPEDFALAQEASGHAAKAAERAEKALTPGDVPVSPDAPATPEGPAGPAGPAVTASLLTLSDGTMLQIQMYDGVPRCVVQTAQGVRASADAADEPVSVTQPRGSRMSEPRDGSSPKTGVMIALKVPPGTASRIAHPGGLPPEELHCTLAFLGDVQTVGEERMAGVLEAAQEVASTSYPLEGTLPAGSGTFNNPDEQPLWLHPGTPGISALRDSLMRSLQIRDLDSLVSQDHPVFQPHVTLAYLEPDEEPPLDADLPNPGPVTFTDLVVQAGPETHTFPLGGGPSIDGVHAVPLPGIPEEPEPTEPPPLAAAARPRRVTITAQTEQVLRRKAELHNRAAHLGQRTSPEALKVVYTRAQQLSPSRAAANQRVAEFLRNLSSRTPGPDQDLYPTPPRRSALADPTDLALEQNQDEIFELLLASAAVPNTDPTRTFSIARALALATRSENPLTRASLPPLLRTLLADGNSSAARSLRARRQLRDRYGRWIEMGGGARFKVSIPGAPGGGEWFHGTVVGQNVANGLVNVQLEDGKIASVPANKMEQPLAILRSPGGSPNSQGVPVPERAADDEHAPTIAKLEKQTPDQQEGVPPDQDVSDALDDAAKELKKRVGDDSTEAQQRDTLVDQVSQAFAQKHEEGALVDRLAEISEAADNMGNRPGAGISDNEREAFKSYAEDLQDVIGALKGPGEPIARLPDAFQPGFVKPNPTPPAPSNRDDPYPGFTEAEVHLFLEMHQDLYNSAPSRARHGGRTPDDVINEPTSRLRGDKKAIARYKEWSKARIEKHGADASDEGASWSNDGAPKPETPEVFRPGFVKPTPDYIPPPANRDNTAEAEQARRDARNKMLEDDLKSGRSPGPLRDATPEPEPANVDLATPDDRMPTVDDFLEQHDLIEAVYTKSDGELQDRLGAAGNVVVNVGQELEDSEIDGPAAVKALDSAINEIDAVMNDHFDDLPEGGEDTLLEAIDGIKALRDKIQASPDKKPASAPEKIAELPAEESGPPHDLTPEERAFAQLDAALALEDIKLANPNVRIDPTALLAQMKRPEVTEAMSRGDDVMLNPTENANRGQTLSVPNDLALALEKHMNDGSQPPRIARLAAQAIANITKPDRDKHRAERDGEQPPTPPVSPEPGGPYPNDDPIVALFDDLAEALDGVAGEQDNDNLGRSLQETRNNLENGEVEIIDAADQIGDLQRDYYNTFRDDGPSREQQSILERLDKLEDMVRASSIPDAVPDTPVVDKDGNPVENGMRVEATELGGHVVRGLVHGTEPDGNKILVETDDGQYVRVDGAENIRVLTADDIEAEGGDPTMRDLPRNEDGIALYPAAEDLPPESEPPLNRDIPDAASADELLPEAELAILRMADALTEAGIGDLRRQSNIATEIFDSPAMLNRALADTPDADGNVQVLVRGKPATFKQADLQTIKDFLEVQMQEHKQGVINLYDGRELTRIENQRIEKAGHTKGILALQDRIRQRSDDAPAAEPVSEPTPWNQAGNDPQSGDGLEEAKAWASALADGLKGNWGANPPTVGGVNARSFFEGLAEKDDPAVMAQLLRTRLARMQPDAQRTLYDRMTAWADTLEGKGAPDADVPGESSSAPDIESRLGDLAEKLNEMDARSNDDENLGYSLDQTAGRLGDGEIDPERAATEVEDIANELYQANRDEGPPREIQELIDALNKAAQDIRDEAFVPPSTDEIEGMRRLDAEDEVPQNADVPDNDFQQQETDFDDLKSDYANGLVDDQEAGVKVQTLVDSLDRIGGLDAQDLASEIIQWFNQRDPNADPAEPEGEKDQFDQVVPAIVSLNREINLPGGKKVQIYTPTDDPTSSVDIAAGERNGREQYVVRYKSAPRSNHDNWDDAVTAMNEERARVGLMKVEERARVDAQGNRQAAEDQQRDADNQRRHEGNLDNADRPLPEGWTRVDGPNGEVIMQGPGRYRAFSDPDGNLHLMVRTPEGDIATLGSFPDWQALNAAMADDAPDRAQRQRDEAAQWLDGHGFSEATVDMVRTMPSASGLRAMIEADPAFARIQAEAADADNADIRNPRERAAAQARNEMLAIQRGMEDFPDVPAPAEAKEWDALAPEQRAIFEDLVADFEANDENDVADALAAFVDGDLSFRDALTPEQRNDVRAELQKRVAVDIADNRLTNERGDQLLDLADKFAGGPEAAVPDTGAIDAVAAKVKALGEAPFADDIAALRGELPLNHPALEAMDAYVNDPGRITYHDMMAALGDVAPLATWERDLLAPVSESPSSPENLAPANPPPGPPRPPGAPAGMETRYHADGVIKDRNGNDIFAGQRVGARRDGKMGTILAVQQDPPYARIRFDDGRVLLRAGGQISLIDPEAFEIHAPQPPAPPANARRIVPFAGLEAEVAVPEVAIPRDGPEAVMADMENLRNGIPKRLARADHSNVKKLAFRNAGYAIGDAMEAMRNLNFDYAAKRLKVARQRLMIAQRNDFGAQVGLMQIRVDSLIRNSQAPAAPAVPGQAPVPGVPAVPADRGPSGGPIDLVPGQMPADYLVPRPLGNFGERGALPDVAGVDRSDAEIAPHPQAADPNARAADYAEWGDRSAQIADAAVNRPSFTALHEALVNGDLVKARQLAATIFSADGKTKFGDRNFTVVAASIAHDEFSDDFPDSEVIDINFEIIDPATGKALKNHKLIRKLITDPNTGKWYLYNDYLSFADDDQGTGFATAWNRNGENWAIANDMDQVRVHAALQAGSAVWALAGFGWDPQYDVNGMGTQAKKLMNHIRREVKTPAEIAQFDDIITRINNATSYDDLPTPIELALIGWRPGLERGSWAGVQGMSRSTGDRKDIDWHGIKRLDPNHREYLQARGYDRAKAASQRVRNNESVAEGLDPEFIQHIGNANFPTLTLTDAQRQSLANALAQGKSLAGLDPETKRKVLEWTRSEVRKGYSEDINYDKSVLILNDALRNEERIDLGGNLDLGVGKALLDVNVDSLKNNLVPGFRVRQLTRGRDGSGVNATWEVTHIESGQVFYMKNEAKHNDRRGPSAGRNSEADINRLLRNAGPGWLGVGENAASNVEKDMIVMQRLGDAVDTRDRPINASFVDNIDGLLGNLQDPTDVLRLYIMDIAMANGDRHDNNWQVARGQDGHWWVYPVDHGLGGGGNGWLVEQLGPQIPANLLAQQVLYRDTLVALREKMGTDLMASEFQRIVTQYRAALAQGGFLDPRFAEVMGAQLEAMANDPKLVLGEIPGGYRP